jgi:hypothetical protein
VASETGGGGEGESAGGVAGERPLVIPIALRTFCMYGVNRGSGRVTEVLAPSAHHQQADNRLCLQVREERREKRRR